MLYIPAFPDAVVLSLFFTAVGFGAAWAIQNLRQPPPPLKPRAQRMLDELDEDKRPAWAKLSH